MKPLKKFTLNIQMGNAAMEEPDHVADALRMVALKLENGHKDGFIYDLNGNKVGTFILK